MCIRDRDISFHVNMDAASLIGMDTFVDGAVTFRPGPVYRCAQDVYKRQVVVTHDSNLKRCTGKNAKVYDLTYAEVAQLDAGRWFSSRFADTRIPRCV